MPLNRATIQLWRILPHAGREEKWNSKTRRQVPAPPGGHLVLRTGRETCPRDQSDDGSDGRAGGPFRLAAVAVVRARFRAGVDERLAEGVAAQLGREVVHDVAQ